MKLEKEMIDALNAPLPTWALKTHPTKNYLTVINPMAVIDRLNEVFGVGAWKTINHHVPTAGSFAVVKVELIIPEYDIHLEQFGGNDNKDEGDAYKGASTDALTKIASYLGIGASIYKGQGNGSTEIKTIPKVQPEYGEGLPKVAFERLVAAYEEKGAMNADMIEYFEKCNQEQRNVINKIKLAKRK